MSLWPAASISFVLLFPLVSIAQIEPQFKEQVIDDQVQIGYGTAIGDVNGDGRPDILLADKKQFAWYENPSWKKHIIAENLTELDNVCLAARDITGDGKVEIAVGGQWNPGDTLNSGAVFYLEPPKDRTKQWSAIKLPNEPVIHRMRWVKTGSDSFALFVSPLHGQGNRGGQGEAVKLMAYEFPNDVKGEWKRTVVENSLHVTHNLDPVQWDKATPAEEVLYAGREGAVLLSLHDGTWNKRPLETVQGSGEIRMGAVSQSSPYIATIEPLHGDKLVLYSASYGVSPNQSNSTITHRVVLDDQIKAGHAVATADLNGNGRQEIVAGWRSPNSEKKVGVKVYWSTNNSGTQWSSAFVDDNTMACEDARIGDLNGDGRPDIVAAGRATNNLKIYWNETAQKPKK